MRIIAGNDIQSPLWQRFIRQEDCFAHDLRWREVIARSYGLRSYYLAVQDGPELVGALPLFRLPGILAPAQLVSLPFLNPAGVAARSPEIGSMLEQAALGAAKRMKVNCLVLRNQAPEPRQPGAEGGYCIMIKPLPRDEQALWAGLRGEERTSTRKSWRSEVKIKRDRALLPDFIKIYQVAMHAFGAPPHSAQWFRALLRAFDQDVEILVAYRRGVPIAAQLLIMWESTCHALWAADLNDYRRYSPSNGLNWEALRLALARGKTRFNFGRSIYGGGSYSHKKHYGALPYTLRYERWDLDGSHGPLPPPGIDTASRLWRMLPLGLCNTLGPKLRRYALPGFGAKTL